LTSLLTSMSRPCFYAELCQKIELDMVLGSLGVTHFSGLLVLAISDAVNTGPRIVCGMALAVPGGVRGTDRRSVGAAFGRRDRPDWECEYLRRTLGRKLGGWYTLLQPTSCRVWLRRLTSSLSRWLTWRSCWKFRWTWLEDGQSVTSCVDRHVSR